MRYPTSTGNSAGIRIATRRTMIRQIVVFSVVVAAAASAADVPAPSVPHWQSLAGQVATCRDSKPRRFDIQMGESILDLGQGLKTTAWTFNGTIPGPVIEACVGDTVTLAVTNTGAMAHGLDTHAFRIDAAKFGPINPGERREIVGTVRTPGVFMYHCANGEMTDQHIKMGMAGLMIVYPRTPVLPPAAHELAVIRNGVYGTPNDAGVIQSDSKAMERNTPSFFLFNGSLEHAPIHVRAGDRVRVYFVNAGPGVAAFHVIGTILDTVRVSGNPANSLTGVQTWEVGAGNGASIDFTIPEAGKFLLVDHDQLAHLADGFVVPFVAGK